MPVTSHVALGSWFLAPACPSIRAVEPLAYSRVSWSGPQQHSGLGRDVARGLGTCFPPICNDKCPGPPSITPAPSTILPPSHLKHDVTTAVLVAGGAGLVEHGGPGQVSTSTDQESALWCSGHLASHYLPHLPCFRAGDLSRHSFSGPEKCSAQQCKDRRGAHEADGTNEAIS